MKPADQQKVVEIFNRALELPPDERPQFLSRECGADARLREEVESLIAFHDDEFLEDDVSESVLEVISGGLLPGHVVCDRFEIMKTLDRGGMGVVYLAEDLKMKRAVALKVLAGNFNQDKKRVEGFKNEALTVSQIKHQNILTVYDFVEDEGTGFIVSEYINGETLRSKLQAGPVDLPTALKIARDVASALEAAHESGFIHRDVKPENVIVQEDGQVKVVDFGIAKLTEPESGEDEPSETGVVQIQDASVFGTENYMSCEQVRAQDVDARTDIWSLGICLYEMLTSVPPFKGGTRIDTFASILKDQPAPLGQRVPESLKTIVKRALRKNPDNRYQTMREFRLDLERSPATLNTRDDTFAKWRKDSGAKIWAALRTCAVLSLILSAASALTIYFFDPIHIELSDHLKSVAQSAQSNEIDVADLARIITAAKVAQAIGSIFHLIAIGIAFLYFRKNLGPQAFRSLREDKVDGGLKANITYSTGYEKVSDWARAREIATAALKYYREYFVWLLFAWMILYFWALVTLFDFGKTNFIVISVFTVANNINTLCIWFCFDILNQEIATGDKTQDEDGLIVKEGRRLPAGLIPIAGILFWFILELFLTSDPTPEASARVELFHYISRMISGIAGGIAMALFVARFQSKFLKSPAWLIFILFLYTVIQALFIFYGGKTPLEEGAAAVVMNAALMLKCLLILYMFWLFQSGRLLFYLVRVKRATTQIESEWLNFREVLEQES